MVGGFYKGDVSEVLMGHESGIFFEHSRPCTWQATTIAGQDYTTVTFGGAAGNTGFFDANAVLKVPTGMLIGCRLSFHGTAVGGFKDFYYDEGDSRIYTIVDHTISATATSLKVVPAIGIGTISSVANDQLFIHTVGLPASNPTYAGWAVDATNSAAAAETSAIDQFIGLASFMTLPDTKVELLQHHVVGLGRQPTILQPGRLHHTGGALEMPLHNPRWLYYCLGREVVDADVLIGHWTRQGAMITGTIVQPGQTYVDVTSTNFAGMTIGIGDYVLIKDITRVPTVYHKHADEGASGDQYWPAGASQLPGDNYHFESTQSSEIRRIVATDTITGGVRLHVDDPFHFAHAPPADLIYGFRFNTGSTEGSPEVNGDRTITNATPRLIFSGDTIPSFSIEHSIRTRDVGSHNAESGPAPGSATDSKQLTRVFKGCKISEWEISATVDAEVKFRAIFDALACYTDTGRMESGANAGDRYTAHRMFNNVGNTAKGRKEAGIANGSEKPFMFYNGTIEMFDAAIANIGAFELRGKTGTELFHVIQGNPVPDVVDAAGRTKKQVPYGGTRNAAIIREGREEFEMEVDVIIGDPLMWNELRTHRNLRGVVGSKGKIIHLVFTKPVSGSTGSTPTFRVLIDDYVITEAPIPVPDDKGLLRSKVKLTAKNVKVLSTDSLFHC